MTTVIINLSKNKIETCEKICLILNFFSDVVYCNCIGYRIFNLVVRIKQEILVKFYFSNFYLHLFLVLKANFIWSMKFCSIRYERYVYVKVSL